MLKRAFLLSTVAFTIVACTSSNPPDVVVSPIEIPEIKIPDTSGISQSVLDAVKWNDDLIRLIKENAEKQKRFDDYTTLSGLQKDLLLKIRAQYGAIYASMPENNDQLLEQAKQFSMEKYPQADNFMHEAFAGEMKTTKDPDYFASYRASYDFAKEVESEKAGAIAQSIASALTVDDILVNITDKYTEEMGRVDRMMLAAVFIKAYQVAEDLELFDKNFVNENKQYFDTETASDISVQFALSLVQRQKRSPDTYLALLVEALEYAQTQEATKDSRPKQWLYALEMADKGLYHYKNAQAAAENPDVPIAE